MKCPDLQTLQKLLLGKLPGPGMDALEKHLLQCDVCIASADALMEGDELVTALRARVVVAVDEEVIARIVERAVPLLSQTETTAAT
jgi:hypothetical protein